MTTAVGQPELSLVVPAYNEEANIERVLLGAAAYLSSKGVSFEITVVDDGSRDRTREVLERLRRDGLPVRIVEHSANRGYGAALRSGIAAARGRYVLLVDGDGQFSVADLERLWPHRAGADAVVGYRQPRRDPPWRRLAGWLYGRLFVRFVFGARYRDVNCGFKLLSRSLLERLELRSDGALISAELLTRARLVGARVVEVAVPHYPRRRGRATGLRPRVVVGVLRELRAVRGAVFATGSPREAKRLRAEYDAVESASF